MNSIQNINKYTCPCCGYLVFSEPPGSYEICPICHWEDDITQLRFPDMRGGANKVSLIEAQKNYADCGAKEERFVTSVRKPTSEDQRDAAWRPMDPAKDQFETLGSKKNQGEGYPTDPTTLYYWKN